MGRLRLGGSIGEPGGWVASPLQLRIIDLAHSKRSEIWRING